eukprot:GHVT01056050.1.p2 GENE.GHVT01056050.1~~GHVT01056050.1.p2  ORF type:complete len:123 (+),score=19.66 GHVT01056050.1:580-948(+)
MGFVAACKTAACVRGRCLISECLRGRRLISAWVRGRCLLNALWQHLTGERGLLFSDAALSEVQEVLESFQPEEFARAGFVAERTVTVQVRIHSLLFQLFEYPQGMGGRRGQEEEKAEAGGSL